MSRVKPLGDWNVGVFAIWLGWGIVTAYAFGHMPTGWAIVTSVVAALVFFWEWRSLSRPITHPTDSPTE